MKVQVLYYAALRDLTQKKEETLEMQSGTAEQLFEQIKKKYSLSLECQDLKVAVNEDYVSWQTSLSDNDVVVFLPPVAGG